MLSHLSVQIRILDPFAAAQFAALDLARGFVLVPLVDLLHYCGFGRLAIRENIVDDILRRFGSNRAVYVDLLEKIRCGDFSADFVDAFPDCSQAAPSLPYRGPHPADIAAGCLQTLHIRRLGALSVKNAGACCHETVFFGKGVSGKSSFSAF